MSMYMYVYKLKVGRYLHYRIGDIYVIKLFRLQKTKECRRKDKSFELNTYVIDKNLGRVRFLLVNNLTNVNTFSL